MAAIIALLFASIGLLAAMASGLYVVLALWCGLAVTHIGCGVLAVIIALAAVIEIVLNAKEAE